MLFYVVYTRHYTLYVADLTVNIETSILHIIINNILFSVGEEKKGPLQWDSTIAGVCIICIMFENSKKKWRKLYIELEIQLDQCTVCKNK